MFRASHRYFASAFKSDVDSPDYADPDVRGMERATKLCRDVYMGTLHLRELEDEYLPRFPLEERENYNQRVQTAVLYNALRRTVRGLAGIVFQRDPFLTDKVPEELRGHFNNIDLSGGNFASFAQDTYDDSLLDGHHAILVDMPAAMDAENRAEEVGRRPYWKGIKKQQILRQRWEIINYGMELVRFAFLETRYEPKSLFGLEPVDYVREYILLPAMVGGKNEVLFRLYRQQEGGTIKDKWQLVDERIMAGIDIIPVVFHYTHRESIGVSRPPLLDLATENVAHFQLTSDRRNALHIAGIPIPVVVGLEEDQAIEISSSKGIQLPEGGEAFYLEPRGSSLAESRQEIRDSEGRMAALGLAMLQRDTRAAETAEARRIEKSETDSSLTKSAKSMKLALEDLVVIHAKWQGIEIEGEGLVDVHTDFDKQTLGAQMVQTLSAMVTAGQLSLSTVLERMRSGKVLPDDFDVDEEMKRIEDDEERLMARLLTAQAPAATGGAPPKEPEAKGSPGVPGGDRSGE